MGEFDFDLEKMKKEQADAQNKKDMFGAIGTIGQGFANIPTANELLYGGKSYAPDIKGAMDSAAKNVVDPSERQAKLYQAYKSAKDAQRSGNDLAKSDIDLKRSDIDLKNSQTGLADNVEAHDVNSPKNQAFRKSIMATAPKIAKAMGPSFDGVTVADKDYIWDPIKLGEQIDGRKQQAGLQYAMKNSEQVDKLAKAFKDDMDADKGRSGNFGKASEKVMQADRLKTLVDSYNAAGGNLPGAQMEELALGMANMISGSTGAARAQVEALVPHTFWGKTQDAKSWLMNEPTGAGQQKFVEQMIHTVDRERETANQQLNEIRANRLGAHERFKKMAPEQYNQMVTRYGINPNASVGAPATMAHEGNQKQLSGGLIDSAKAAQFPPGVQEYADQHNLAPDVAFRILKNRGDIK